MICRGDIVLVDLNDAFGHEQRGLRPAIVIQNDIGNRFSPTIIIVPVSSKTPRLPTHVALESDCFDQPSAALCEQIRVIDRRKVIDRLGKLTIEDLAAVERATAIAIGFEAKQRQEALAKIH